MSPEKSGPFLAVLLIALCILPLGLGSTGVARQTMDGGGGPNSPGNEREHATVLVAWHHYGTSQLQGAQNYLHAALPPGH